MNHLKTEQLADEAYKEFKRNWNAMDGGKHDCGEPTRIEIWHHAFRAGIMSASKSEQSDKTVSASAKSQRKA